MTTAWRRLARNERGATLVEFALILPVLLFVMMATAELTFQEYVQTVLNGAMQKAARDSTIQGNNSDAQIAALDTAVQAMVKRVVPSATFQPAQRTNYDNYAAIAGESFVDSKYPDAVNGTYDGICNHNEQYNDVNGNGRYDLNLGSSGQGGANEVTTYLISMSYQRMFPARIVGWGDTVTLSSSTILKNQPYATQTVNNGTTTGTCP